MRLWLANALWYEPQSISSCSDWQMCSYMIGCVNAVMRLWLKYSLLCGAVMLYCFG